MRWQACEATSYKQESAVGIASSAIFKRPELSSYAAQGRFSGKTVMPDFKGRDREFNSFRTRIRDGMRQGPNFAGQYISLSRSGAVRGAHSLSSPTIKRAARVHSPVAGKSTCI
jgi:hypothetical protein